MNIPIAFVTEKYLEHLEAMQAMSVDVAADYLVMAATLAYLKSRELVPSPEPLEAAGEDGEAVLDPREELIRRLLEYQKYKDAAERLGGRPIEGRTVFGRGALVEAGEAAPRPFAETSVWKLIEAFGRLLEKAGPVATHDVVVDRISIGGRINQLVDRLEAGGGSLRFATLFDLTRPEPELRNQIVVTLLAILELARLKVVRVLQDAREGAEGGNDDDTLYVSVVPGASLEAARATEVTAAHGEGPAEEAEEKHEEA